MSNKLYAGIGSRKAPLKVLDYFRSLGSRLATDGWVLRSGGADGCDTAFEQGCLDAHGKHEIWLPWIGFNKHKDSGCYPDKRHYKLAATVHPAWHRLTRGAMALHARNTCQILGYELNAPVSFVVCWTPDGCESKATRSKDTGGTATAIVLADEYGIPVFNLANPTFKERLENHIKVYNHAN